MNLNIWLGVLLVFIAGYGVAYTTGHSKGYRSAQIEYQNKIQELTLKNIEQTQAVIKEWKDRENGLVSDYLKKIEILKEEHKNEIESIQSNQLSDTVTVPECLQPANKPSSERVSSASKAGSNTVCYSEADILRKVKESLDITEECDELAHRYNTLLEVVQTYTGESPSGKGNGF